MNSDKSTILSLKNVSYMVNNKEINKDISINISPSDIVSVIGPNGSGKTTLLRLIANEINPSSGHILFQGKNLSNWNIDCLSKQRAVLPQNGYISFPFKVKEIIEMGRYPFRFDIPKNKNQRIVDNLIDIFDLDVFKNRDYTTLSGGEKQRVQLARVFSQIWSESDCSNKLLILDEPTSFLDVNHQKQLFQIINIFKRKGLTIVMVLHDINQAISNANKIVMLKNSKLIQFGNTRDVITLKNLKKVFDIELNIINVNSDDIPLVYI